MWQRIRTIKPAFFENEELAALPALARLLFIGLWTVADRDGRLEDRPRRLKAQLLPYEEADLDALLTALAGGRFIQRYSVEGRDYIQIVNFAKHQRPHPKEMCEGFPPLPAGADIIPLNAVKCREKVEPGREKVEPGREKIPQEEIQEENQERKRKKGSVRGRARATTPLPDVLPLTDALRAFALEGGLDPELEFQSFKDSARAHGRKYVDWAAAFRNWCRNANKFQLQRMPR